MMSPVRTAIKLGITRRIQMKRYKLTAVGAILALSILRSANCQEPPIYQSKTARDAQTVILNLFGSEKTGKEAIKLDKKAEDAATQARLWDEHYGNNKPYVPTAADLAEQKLEAERKRQADLASEEKKKELAETGLWGPPTDPALKKWTERRISEDLKKWRAEHPMDPDQGKKATWEFIDNVTGNDGASGGREVARDAAKEAARDARDAATAARESARSATDGMRPTHDANCADGH
jgi:hypothetical protein